MGDGRQERLDELEQRIAELTVRIQHREDRVPFGAETRSLNWADDLRKLEAERARLLADREG